MAYVAVKGGERAILNSHKLLAQTRRGNPDQAELTVAQISEQFGLAVDRVMTEGSLYERELAALALKQAQGDIVEAIFLLRAYRTTLPRVAVSEPIRTASMGIRRRISATFKDVPGGQVLGPTYDYTHRLLDFQLMANGPTIPTSEEETETELDEHLPSVIDALDAEGLIEPETDTRPDADVFDVSREAMHFPAGRDQRLQLLARGDEGYILGLAYSTVRGYGTTHPFVAELRLGEVEVEIVPEELGFSVTIAEITVTECQMVNKFHGTDQLAPQFTRGYGLSFGHCERKAMAMALLDRAMRTCELGEDAPYVAQDQEFVLAHCDGVEASGMVSHYKLPHYVDFQAELQLVRRLREEFEANRAEGGDE